MDDDSALALVETPPSRVQQVTTSFITAVDSGGRKEAAALGTSYGAVLTRLDNDLAKLEAAIKAKGGTPTPNDIFRMERYRELIRHANTLIDEYGKFTEGRLSAGQNAAITAAYNNSAMMTVAAGGNAAIATGWAGINPTTMLNLQGQLAADGPTHQIIESLAPDATAAIREAILVGVATGAGLDKIMRDIRAAADYPRVRAERLVRTEILRAANEGLRQGFTDLGIKQWRWSASLSARTCPACLAMNGRIFPMTVSMPRHVQCRCSMSPVVPGVPAPGWVDGEEWLRRQRSNVQDQILGPTAGQAFRDGVFKLNDLVQITTDPVWGASVSRKSNKSLYAGFDAVQRKWWDRVIVPKVQNAAIAKASATRAATKRAQAMRELRRSPTVATSSESATGASSIPWSPTMTRAQAAAWAADASPLVQGKEFWHGTRATAADSIRASGFDVSIISNGRVFGGGVYMGDQRRIAESYAGWDEGANVLELRVRIKNPQPYESIIGSQADYDFLNARVDEYTELHKDYIRRGNEATSVKESQAILKAMESDPRVSDPKGYALGELAKSKGIDGWYVTSEGYWIIPDPKNVVVIVD